MSTPVLSDAQIVKSFVAFRTHKDHGLLRWVSYKFLLMPASLASKIVQCILEIGSSFFLADKKKFAFIELLYTMLSTFLLICTTALLGKIYSFHSIGKETETQRV